MRRLLLALLALALPIGLTLTTAPAAHAAWSGNICSNDQGPGADWRICVQTHTVTSGGGYLMDRVQVCAWHMSGGSGRFTGFKSATLQEYTSSGNPNGATTVPNTAVGSCSNTPTGGWAGGPFQSGAAAYFVFGATAANSPGFDEHASVSGPCCGGGG